MNWLQRGRDRVWVLGAVTASALLQFATIGWRSVWHDESFTAMLIEYDYSELLRRAMLDVHPPLYYLLLKPWAAVFGSSEAALRSFSAVCMLATLMVAFCLVRKLFGSAAARFCLPFLVLGPFIVRYGMEARMYGLAALLMVSATYVLVRLLRDSPARSYLWWAAYVLLMAAMLYTHYFAGLILPVHWLFVALEVKRRRRLPWRTLPFKLPRTWWLANIGIAGLFLPWLPVFLDQAGEVNTGFWIGEVTIRTLPETATTLLLLRPLWLLPPLVAGLFFGWLVWLLVTAGLVYRRANQTERNGLWLLGLYLLLPALVLYGLSASPLVVSVYYVRYFALFAIGLYAWLGVVCYLRLKQRPGPVSWLLTVVTLGVLISGVVSVYLPGEFSDIRNDRFAMKQLIQEITAHGQPDDVIVATDLGVYFDLRYYNPTNQVVRVHSSYEPRGYGNWSLVYDRPEVMLYDYVAVTSPSGHVWYVTGSDQELAELPNNWQAVTPVIESGYAKLIRFRIGD